MYADPRHIRNCRINLSVTDTERRAIEALAELNGTQPSVFVRELITEFMRSQQLDCGHAAAGMPATQVARIARSCVTQMSAPPPTEKPVEVCFSEQEHQALEQHAQAKGMSVQQFVEHAVAEQLRIRYVTPKRTGNVFRIRP